MSPVQAKENSQQNRSYELVQLLLAGVYLGALPIPKIGLSLPVSCQA